MATFWGIRNNLPLDSAWDVGTKIENSERHGQIKLDLEENTENEGEELYHTDVFFLWGHKFTI